MPISPQLNYHSVDPIDIGRRRLDTAQTRLYIIHMYEKAAILTRHLIYLCPLVSPAGTNVFGAELASPRRRRRLYPSPITRLQYESAARIDCSCCCCCWWCYERASAARIIWAMESVRPRGCMCAVRGRVDFCGLMGEEIELGVECCVSVW